MVHVTSIDEARESIRAGGGRTVTPPTAIVGVGWQQYFLDPEGNPFAVWQTDPAAR